MVEIEAATLFFFQLHVFVKHNYIMIVKHTCNKLKYNSRMLNLTAPASRNENPHCMRKTTMPMMTRKNESELNIRTFRFDSTSESDNSEEMFPPTFGMSFLAISFETEVLIDSKDIFKLSS